MESQVARVFKNLNIFHHNASANLHYFGIFSHKPRKVPS